MIILSESSIQTEPKRRRKKCQKNLYQNRNGKVKYLTRKCIRNWFVHPLHEKIEKNGEKQNISMLLNIHKYMKKNWKQFLWSQKKRNRKDTCFDFSAIFK